jgi:hypothetical protein
MKKFFATIAAAIATLFSFTGCAVLESEPAKVLGDTAVNVFNQALTTATAVLTSEGTQALAIAAAQSYVASQIQEPTAQAACNEIIAQAVPTIAEGIKKIGTRGGTTKERAVLTTRAYLATPEYQELLEKCVADYNKKVK